MWAECVGSRVCAPVLEDLAREHSRLSSHEPPLADGAFRAKERPRVWDRSEAAVFAGYRRLGTLKRSFQTGVLLGKPLKAE